MVSRVTWHPTGQIYAAQSDARRRGERHRGQSRARRCQHKAGVGDRKSRPDSTRQFFHSRAEFSATIYQKRLTSLLLQAGVSPSYGYSTTFINGGEFTNQGIELSLRSTPVTLRNGFTWVNTVTLFRNYSVVNALPVPPFTVENRIGIRQRLSRAGEVRIGNCEPQHHRDRRPPCVGG